MFNYTTITLCMLITTCYINGFPHKQTFLLQLIESKCTAEGTDGKLLRLFANLDGI